MVPAFGMVILPQNLSTGNRQVPGWSCILSVSIMLLEECTHRMMFVCFGSPRHIHCKAEQDQLLVGRSLRWGQAQSRTKRGGPRGGFNYAETLVQDGTVGDNGTTGGTLNQPILYVLVRSTPPLGARSSCATHTS